MQNDIFENMLHTHTCSSSHQYHVNVWICMYRAVYCAIHMPFVSRNKRNKNIKWILSNVHQKLTKSLDLPIICRPRNLIARLSYSLSRVWIDLRRFVCVRLTVQQYGQRNLRCNVVRAWDKMGFFVFRVANILARIIYVMTNNTC